MDTLFSIIIPAHNEEKYIEKCLDSIMLAAKEVPDKAEIIVVANRCIDRTADIAKRFGAKVVINNDKCISSIRNAGVKASNGEIIVTIDADSMMSKDSLAEIKEMLGSGKYIGGGTTPKFDRMSLGIAVSAVYIALNLIPVMIRSGGMLSGAMFWCKRQDFDSIGGFNEELVSLEDMDFAKRLKAFGKTCGKKYGTLKKSYVITSSRKFDEFGDWYLLKNRKLTKAIFTGKNREAADKFYYDVRQQPENVPCTNTMVEKEKFTPDIKLIIENGTILKGANSPDMLTELIVPEGITEIAPQAFKRCRNLESVVLPDSIRKIGEAAFEWCSALSSVNFPEGLQELGKRSLAVTGIKEAVLPMSIKCIDSEAFGACKELKKIVFPINNVQIESGAFRCDAQIYVRSENDIAPIYADSDSSRKTDDVFFRLDIMRNGDYLNKKLAEKEKYWKNAVIWEQGNMLAASYYVVTEDEKALEFVMKSVNDPIFSRFDNADILIKKLMQKGLIDDETIINYIKFILRNTVNRKFSPEYRVLRTILEYMKNERGIGLPEYSQIELADCIGKICPVPWDKAYFRVHNDDKFSFDYCYTEKDTGISVSKATESKRYGYILDYRRPDDISEQLSVRINEYIKLYKETSGDKMWKAVTFSVESIEKYSIEYEWDDVLPVSEWEKKYAGEIPEVFPSEYPTEKLEEETKNDLPSMDIPTANEAMSLSVKELYEIFRNAYDILGTDYIEMNGGASESSLRKFKNYFETEPEPELLEWLKYCNGMKVNGETIYDINNNVYETDYVPCEAFTFADNACCGYGIMFDTGKMWCFDHDFGDNEYSFMDLLCNYYIEGLSEVVHEYEDKREKLYLDKKGRAFSDSWAEFVCKYFGADKIKAEAAKSRAKQEISSFERFYVERIADLYDNYIMTVCDGEKII